MAIDKRDLGIKVNVDSQDRTGPGLRDAGNNLKKFQTQLDKTKQAAQALVAVGAKLAAMGAGLAALTIFPVKTAAAFEKAMSGVKAVTSGTTEEFREMEKVAKELGATTKFTATEAASGLRFLGMAGLSAKESMDALAPSLTLAAAGELEVAEAADIATNVMSAMSIPVEGLTHVMDVLANTATSSNTNVRELAEAMNYVALEAATAGIDVDELNGILAELANNGKKGSRAGTSLRGVILALADVTPKAQKALDKLKVQIAKNTDGSIDYITTMERLHAANIGTEESLAIFKRTAGGAALAIAKGTERIREYTKANKEADGVARAMAKTMQENLQGAVIESSSAFEGLKIALGTPLLEPITKVIKEFTKYIRVLRDIVSTHPEATKVILAATGILGGLTFVLGSTLAATGLLALAVVNLTQAYQLLIATKIGTFLAEVILGFGGMTGAVHALTVAFAGLTAVQALSMAAILAWSGYQIYRAIGALQEWAGAVVTARADAAAWREEMDKHKDALKDEGKNIEEVTSLTYEQAVAYAEVVKEKIKYYTAAVAAQTRLGKDSTEESKKLKALQEDYRVLYTHIREIKPPEPISEETAKSYDRLAEKVELAQRRLQSFSDLYKQLSNTVKTYSEKVMKWNEEMVMSKLTSQEKIKRVELAAVESTELFAEKQKAATEGLSEFRDAIHEREFEAAGGLAKKVRDLYKEAIDYGSSSLSSIKKHFDDIISSAENAYQKATREVEKYANEVKKIEQEITDSKKSDAAILRDLTRKTMTEEEQWNDRRAEAEDDLSRIKKLARKDDEKSLRDALKLAEEAIGKYRDLGSEVKTSSGETSRTLEETTNLAKDGITAIVDLKKKIYRELLTAAEDAKIGAEESAKEIKEALDKATEDRDAVIIAKLEGLDEVEASLDALEDDIRTVTVKVETAQSKAGGGPVHTFAKGGKLPGESKIDSIPVLARPGEWFIKNEAAHFWERMGGSSFMAGINDPMSKAGEKIRGALNGIQNFNLGGMVKSMIPRFAEGGTMAFDSTKLASALSKVEALASSSGVRSLEMQNLGRLELGIGGRVYPILGESQTLEQLKTAIEKEKLVRSNF